MGIESEDVASAPEPASRRRPTLIGSSLRRLRAGLLGGGAWSFVVATAGVNGFNFVFHVLVSRLLGPSHYGALGALLNFISVLAVPLGAIQLAVTQAVARAKTQTTSLRRIVRTTTLAGLAAMFGFWFLSPVLGRFLNLGSGSSLLILGAWIPLAIVGAVLQGALMGELRFLPVAVALFIGGGALRLLTGVALVLLGFGLEGAVAATVIGQAVTSLMLLGVAHRALMTTDYHPLRISMRDAGLSIAALAGYTAFTGIDSFLAQHFLAGKAAGIYVAGSMAGHIAMFLPGALVMVAFPRLASDSGGSPAGRKTLIETLKLTSVISAAAVLVLAGLSHLIVRILFGAKYVTAAAIVGQLALASSLLGLIGLLTYFHIARRSACALISWLGVAIVWLIVSFAHGHIENIAMATMLTSVGTLMIMFVPTVGALLRSVSEQQRTEAATTEMPEAQVELTLVMPFYNPGQRLIHHVGEAVRTLQSEHVSFEIIAVADGCTDGSAETLRGFPTVKIIELDQNQGKGAALRQGLVHGHGEYLGFIDGDGDIPAAILPRFVKAIRETQADVVLGSKLHPESDVIYPPIRKLYSYGYQQLNRLLFGLPVRDTQTGVKLIRREVVIQVLPRLLEKRFAFDVELLAVAKRLGFDKFVELPVTIGERFSSSISIRTVYRMLLDTLAIFHRMYVMRYYGPRRDSALYCSVDQQASQMTEPQMTPEPESSDILPLLSPGLIE